jgi:hypothetical protein
MKLMILFFLTGFAVAQISGQPSASPTASSVGYISGRILSVQGDAVPSADILVVGSSSSSTPKARATADSQGRFKVDGLAFGEYVIYPYKLSESYALSVNSFFADDPERFILDSSHPSVARDLRMQPKSGKLKVSVRNAVTKAPIPNADLWLCRTAEPTRAGQLSTGPDGTSEHTVPSNVAVSMFADPPGFEPRLESNIVVGPLKVREIQMDLVPTESPSKVKVNGQCHFPWQQ